MRRWSHVLFPSCSNPQIRIRFSARRLLKERAAARASVSNFNVQYLEETCQQKRVKFVTILFRYWNVAVDPDSAIVSPLIFVNCCGARVLLRALRLFLGVDRRDGGLVLVYRA